MAELETHTLPGGRVSLITVRGPTTDADLIAALEAFYARGPTLHLMWDLSSADLSEVDTDGLRRVLATARSLAAGRPGGRTAIIAPEDLQYGLSRLYETLADLAGHAIGHKVVRTAAEAHEWLGTSA